MFAVSKVLRISFCLLFALTITSQNSFAEPTLDGDAEDIVCAATLPCHPPAFEVLENFKTGPCAIVYKKACDRWKDVKVKADALDIAAEKLLQCQQSKKDKNKKSAKNK